MKNMISIFMLIVGLALFGIALENPAWSADTSLSDIKDKGKLVVGVDIPYGVMEFYDKSGKATGIDIDIAKEIASRMGVKIELSTMPFSELFGALKSGTMDIVISAVTITQERQKSMLFSVPYLDAGVSVAVKKDNMEIGSVRDLKDKKVGVLKGTVAEKLVADSEDINPSLVRLYEKNDRRIQDLLEEKIDAIVVHFLVKESPTLKLVGEPLSQSFYGIVARLNDNALMDEINQALRELKRTGKLKAIIKKYLSSK